LDEKVEREKLGRTCMKITVAVCFPLGERVRIFKEVAISSTRPRWYLALKRWRPEIVRIERKTRVAMMMAREGCVPNMPPPF
jgi:hypothetical protein